MMIWRKQSFWRCPKQDENLCCGGSEQEHLVLCLCILYTVCIYLYLPRGILFKPFLAKAPFAHQERFSKVESFLEIP